VSTIETLGHYLVRVKAVERVNLTKISYTAIGDLAFGAFLVGIAIGLIIGTIIYL
jgi:hypothetical protein